MQSTSHAAARHAASRGAVMALVPRASAAQSVVVLKGKLTGAIINGQLVLVRDSGIELRRSPADVDRVLTAGRCAPFSNPPVGEKS